MKNSASELLNTLHQSVSMMHSCLSCLRTLQCVHHAHRISVRAPPSVGDGAQGVGTDTRLDITTAKAIFHSEILAPLVREGVVDAKEFVKGLKAALREPATMTVAALCLFSTAEKVAQDNLAVEAVEGLFRSSFEDHKNSDGLVSFSALSSTGTFKGWAAATGFDATSTPNEDGKQQHVNNFNDFEELSRLCERGGAQSGICLLKNAWLQETFAEAQRTGVPFLLPSRNALPSDASTRDPSRRTRCTSLPSRTVGPAQVNRIPRTGSSRTSLSCWDTWTPPDTSVTTILWVRS